MQRVQVDNQLPSAVFPVLLQPSWAPEETADVRTPPPAVELRVQTNFATPGLVFYETLSLRVQTMHLMVDTLLARHLLLYLYELSADLAQILTCLLSAFLPAVGVAPSSPADKPQKKCLCFVSVGSEFEGAQTALFLWCVSGGACEVEEHAATARALQRSR